MFWCSAMRCTAKRSGARWKSLCTEWRLAQRRMLRRLREPENLAGCSLEGGDEAERPAFIESPDAEGAHEGTAAVDAGAGCGKAQHGLHRSEPRLLAGTRTARGAALPGMRESDLHAALSGRRKGEGICAIDRGRRFRRGSSKDTGRQRIAGDYGKSLSAGRSLRVRLHAGQGQKCPAAGDRVFGTVRCRLRAADGDSPLAESSADRQESGGSG